MPLYLAIVYMNVWLTELGLTRPEILLNNTIVLLCSGLLMPLTGALADRFGALKIMKLGLLNLVLFSLPFYFYLTSDPSWQKYFFLQAFLVLTNASIITPLSSFLPELFPSIHRYTGLSVSYTIGQATLGGLTPLLAALLTSAIGQKWAPSLLLCGASILFLICLKLCQKPGLIKS